jgi:hypothetical protein
MRTIEDLLIINYYYYLIQPSYYFTGAAVAWNEQRLAAN